MDERELQNVLVLIETAQRAGRSEEELVEIVDRYFGEETSFAFASPETCYASSARSAASGSSQTRK